MGVSLDAICKYIKNHFEISDCLRFAPVIFIENLEMGNTLKGSEDRKPMKQRQIAHLPVCLN